VGYQGLDDIISTFNADINDVCSQGMVDTLERIWRSRRTVTTSEGESPGQSADVISVQSVFQCSGGDDKHHLGYGNLSSYLIDLSINARDNTWKCVISPTHGHPVSHPHGSSPCDVSVITRNDTSTDTHKRVFQGSLFGDSTEDRLDMPQSLHTPSSGQGRRDPKALHLTHPSSTLPSAHTTTSTTNTAATTATTISTNKTAALAPHMTQALKSSVPSPSSSSHRPHAHDPPLVVNHRTRSTTHVPLFLQKRLLLRCAAEFLTQKDIFSSRRQKFSHVIESE
jgi:hypothetical protein